MTQSSLHRRGPQAARSAVLLLHGRGGSAEDILGLHRALVSAAERPDAFDDVAFVALEAPGNSWYPGSFLAPREQNQPTLDASLATVAEAIDRLRAEVGPRLALAGFSQGACLSAESAARGVGPLAAVLGFTGGLIGATLDTAAHTADLSGTEVLLTGGDPDPFVPWGRVAESASVLEGLGATVTTKRFPGKPHSVDAAEIRLAAQTLERAFGATGA